MLITAVVAVALVGCDPTIPADERYGQLLSPKEVKGCPKGCVPYVTAPNDSLYWIAQRAYGKGYKLYLIQKQNPKLLAAITLPNGSLEKGRILFLPPDERGDPVDAQKAEERWYFVPR